MQQLFSTVVLRQYAAALCTLRECVVRCPDALWQQPVVNCPFSQTVFHTLFFADLYLGDDVPEIRNQEFHRQHAEVFGNYEQMEDRVAIGTYSKGFILEYLQFTADKAEAVVSREDESRLSETAKFPWARLSRAEIHVYNIRHIQHHAAQLIARLRKDAGIDMPWVKSGWQEFTDVD